MGHRCGAGCRRKTGRSRGCPSCGSKRALDAGGRVRTITRHMIDDPHIGMTRKVVAYALNNWFLKGIRTGGDGRESWNYLAYVPELDQVVRVSVSLDDERIVNAFRDRGATQAYRRNNRDYFYRHYKSLEVKDADSDL